MTDLPPVIVPARFCGPPSSANGGWSAGAIAAVAGADCPEDHARPWPTVTVSLLAPPPLDTPMAVSPGETSAAGEEAGVVASYDGRPVLRARCSHERLVDVEPVAPADARAAMTTYHGLGSHPFPTCFACGTGRADGDGLRIFPGRVADQEGLARVAATWTPEPSVAEDFHSYGDERPRASLPVTWAALDCVGGWAGDLEERLMVLARMSARIDSLPEIGEEHVVVGLGRGREGRKAWTSATLYDADGRVVGTAEHLWVEVDPADFA